MFYEKLLLLFETNAVSLQMVAIVPTLTIKLLAPLLFLFFVTIIEKTNIISRIVLIVYCLYGYNYKYSFIKRGYFYAN